MTLHMLDTNVLSEIVKNPEGAAAETFSQMNPGDVCVSIIASAEVLFGLEINRGTRVGAAMRVLLDNLDVKLLEAPADRLYAEIRADLKRRGLAITPNDYLIAAHAMALDAILVTNDRAFEFVRGLKIENWLRP